MKTPLHGNSAVLHVHSFPLILTYPDAIRIQIGAL